MHQLFAADRYLHALFAGELTNQNREYYKVNDNMNYYIFASKSHTICDIIVLRSRVRTNKNENIELSFHTFLRIYFIKLQIKLT